jgi:arylsulfatase A
MRNFLAAAFLTACAAPVAAADVPNVVYILADDFGYGDAGCYNPKSKIPTPNIDRLAKEGMRFTDAHSGSSVCSPTRYGILTGRYAWRTKLRRGVLGPYDPPLIAADRLTVPALFQQKGYHTACVGKWHLGWDWPKADGNVVFDKPITNGPTARGFDWYFGTDVPNYPPYCFIDNDRTVGNPTAEKTERDLNGRPGAMLPGWKFDAILPTLTEKATGYVAERAKDGKPFFLYFPLTSPHEPIAPSAKFKGKSGISDLADFFMETDWAVGEVLAALDKHKLAANTLVIFACDNGHAKYTGLPALEKAGHAVSGPLRGYKADVYEGGHRVPFLVRWPGTVKPGSVCDETVCHTDLFATAAAILGAKVPDTAGEDSVSLLPLLKGEKPERPSREAVVHQASDGTLAIRRGKWKLIFAGPPDAPADELYDLAADLGETTSVATNHPEVVQQLTKLMERLIADGRSTPGAKQPNDVKTPLHITQPKKK